MEQSVINGGDSARDHLWASVEKKRKRGRAAFRRWLAVVLVISLILIGTLVASSLASSPLDKSTTILPAENLSKAVTDLTGPAAADEVWLPEKLELNIYHYSDGETEKETIELPIGETSAFKEWEHILPPSTARVYQRLEISYPDQLDDDQPGSFSVYGSSGVTIEGPTVVTLYFEEGMNGSDMGTCPGDNEWHNDLKPPDRHVYYDGPDLECQLKASQLLPGGPDQRRFTAVINTKIFDRTKEYSNTLRLNLTYKRGAAPPPPPPSKTTVQGRVYVPGKPYPLIGAKVVLMRFNSNGTRTILDRTFTEAPYGQYVLYDVPVQANLEVWAILEHAARSPSTFRITHTPAGQLGHAFKGLNLNPNVPVGQVVQDIVFSEDAAVNSFVPKKDLDDLGLIYYHTHQAWQLADSILGQPLDNNLPLDVYAFGNGKETYFRGQRTNDPLTIGINPFIYINAKQSPLTHRYRPDNREWHEYGHYIMNETDNNRIPYRPGDTNHGGWENPSSTDSWVEGFAAFYSLIVSRDVAGEEEPHLYTSIDLEQNYEAKTDEEFALTGLLWDLVDPVDQYDLSINVNAAPGTTSDCVEISFANQLWGLLATDWGDQVPGPAIAEEGFGYIYDIKHLYDVLKANGVGSSHSHDRANMDDLDELFIAHGFFFDQNNNDLYDPGEEIGRSAEGVPGRTDRRNFPDEPGSFIRYNAVNVQDGTPVDVINFHVTVEFSPDFAHYNYEFTTNDSDTPGLIYFYGPDPQYVATISVTARGLGTVSTGPLVFENKDYWSAMAGSPAEHFLSHTFQMKEAPGTYLPVIMAGSRLQALAMTARPKSNQESNPCLPENVDPTPGPPIVTSVVPNSAVHNSTILVTVYGQNFQPGAVAYIGATLLSNIEQTGSEMLTGTLLPGLTPGVYDVSVINPNGLSDTLEEAFTIIPQGGSTPTPTATPTAQATASATPTATPVVTGPKGINGRVTLNGQPEEDLRIDLMRLSNNEWTQVIDTRTDAQGRYDFGSPPSLSSGDAYAIWYLNTDADPNPGPGYLWLWMGNKIPSYKPGDVLEGGDFEALDVPLLSPEDGAEVTLPAEFCWQQRGLANDNYVVVFYSITRDEIALTDYMGNVPCVTITGFPQTWGSGDPYQWWMHVYQGSNPDSKPFNYGVSYGDRLVTVNKTADDIGPGVGIVPRIEN